MKYSGKAALLFCLITLTASLIGQEAEGSIPPSDSPLTLDPIEADIGKGINDDTGEGLGSDIETDFEVKKEADENSEDLLMATMALDISVATYYDLLAWCRRLGLDETGNRDSLQNILYQHYGVERPLTESSDGKGNLLVLEDSNLLDSKTINGNTNITFTGNVALTFSEVGGTVHSISADILDFNQDQQIITAYGNVRYELKKVGDEAPEVFTGNSLTFDIDTWAGLFFQGTSKRDTTIKDKQDNEVIKFYYYGDVIYRSSGDTVILSDGSITTCDEEDPHLEIKAKKIWVLAPGEWAIYNGFFYVGRVPMFYIPGLLKNGDPLFFNPTVGFISNSGYTFQTTSYLLGEKEKKEEDSIVDFMQVSGNEDVEREIDGLFLRKSNGLNSFQNKSREYARSSNSTLKLMFDVYSYLGVFAGVSGTLNKLGPVTKMALYIGIAKSREIYNTGSGYTPLYKNDDDEYVSNWENGFFMNFAVPFRFAFDVNASMSIGKFSLGLDLPIYSDPYFLLDFDNRKEDIELDQFSDFSSEDQSERRSDGSPISSEKWELKTSFKPSTGILSPWLSTAALNKLNFSMTWSRKSISSSLLDSSIDSFFFPSGFSYFDFSLNFSGKLSGNQLEEQKVEAEFSEASPGLVSPWMDEDDRPEDEIEKEIESLPGELESEAVETLLIQGIQSNTSVSQIQEIDWYSQSISWYIKPQGSFYSKFDSEGWDHPEEINYETEYQVFRGSGKANIGYSSSIADKFLSISDTFDGSAKYDNYFLQGDNLTDEEWQNYQDQADALNNLQLNNTLTLNFLPLQYISLVKSSSIKYQFKTNLFLWDWDSDLGDYRTDYFEWNEDRILNHSLSLNLKGEFWGETQSLNSSFNLPPDEMSFSTALNLITGPLKSVFGLSLKEKTDSEDVRTWEKQPLSLSETLSLNEHFTLSEKITYLWNDEEWGNSTTNAVLNLFDKNMKLSGVLSYNLDEITPESAEIKLNLWDLTASYKLKRQYPYSFSLEEGWQKVENSEEGFLSDYLSLSYGYETTDLRFWKNRINLSAKINTSWNMDLIQFTNSSFTFDVTLSCTIKDFITFSFVSNSKNDATFRYFPVMADATGVETLNPLSDLAQSFNFFNRQDRVNSNFNLNSIKLSLTHDLHDWDLVLDLDGSPQKVERDGYNVYEWQSTFSIYVNWKAWSDLEAKVDINDNEIVF